MTTTRDSLRSRRGAKGPVDLSVDQFLTQQRRVYWDWLCSVSPSESERLKYLSGFDQATARARPELVKRAAVASEASQASRRSQLLAAAVGVLLGIPATVFSTWVYNKLYPTAAVVDDQLRVQGLVASQEGYYFLFSKTDKTSRDGFIEVRYAIGTDTANYRCNVSVSEPSLFELYRFDSACKRVVFKFKQPALLWADWDQRNAAVIFSISITSEKGQRWEGSQGIGYAFYKNL